MVELDALFLPQLLDKVAVKLLFVSGVFQGIPDEIDLVHIQLDIIPAADHREDGDRFFRFGLCAGRSSWKVLRIKLGGEISLLQHMLLVWIFRLFP